MKTPNTGQLKIGFTSAFFPMPQNKNIAIRTLASSPLILIGLLILLQGSSCKKALEVPLPKTQLAAKTVFESDATASAVLSNLYIKTANNSAGSLGSVTGLGVLLADETDSYTTTPYLIELYNNQLTATNTYSIGHWNTAYSVIYQANVLLEGLTNNPHISPALSKQLQGEAYFFRALSHLYLTSFFGKVPIVHSTDYQLNALIPQSEIPEVYTAIISDLMAAKELLPADYTSFAGERIRASKWAASALLARSYLYAGDWEKAKTEASLVINQSSLFSLSPLSDVFLKNSKEAIMQYKPTSTSINTNDGNIFVLTGKPTQTALSPAFMAGFEPGDLRKSSWTGKVTASGTDYFFPYKYKVKTGTVLSEYSMMLRLGEMYLIRAEAQARLDELPPAMADLDIIRSRAGLSKIALTNPSITKEALMEAILLGRKYELFSEWAHRWIDLKRFGKAEQVLAAIKPAFRPSALLLPLPDYEVRVNPMLKQNPGY